ncbi:MAG: 3-dehydroquinate synthase [Candidatus Omnitrophica bacterium]|nr:3-dehydroquinate synthase [Candidatus Omnitrophota bacterium]
MRKIKVDLKRLKYDIIIGKGAISRISGVISGIGFKGPVVVISDRNVRALFGKYISKGLLSLPNRVINIDVPASERAKSIDVFQATIRRIAKATRKHKPLIVAIGGGVVGDLSGFIAATFRRGVPVIQVPTTLLAGVDSSIGGKTGIDIPEAKNLIGAFKQPEAVIVDTEFLKALPERQLVNGMGEVIKYGVIKNPGLFRYLEHNIAKIFRKDDAAFARVLYDCALIKARIVEKDEFDAKDIRIILNFGHTLGHAVEAASGYSDGYNHGESVGLGMLMASGIALRLGILTQRDHDRIKDLVKRAGLPLLAGRLAVQKVMGAYSHDKKFVKGLNRFVLPVRIGGVVVREGISENLIKAVVREHVREQN